MRVCVLVYIIDAVAILMQLCEMQKAMKRKNVSECLMHLAWVVALCAAMLLVALTA